MKITREIIRPITLIPILLMIFFCSSCKKQEKKEILIDKISHTNFENALQVDGIVQAVRSTTISCPREARGGTIVFIVKDGTMVKEGDVLCILESAEMQNQYDDILIELEKVKAYRNKSIAELDMQYAILDAQVKSNVAQTAIANLDSLQLKYLSPVKRRIKELELQITAIQKAKLERKLKSLEVINKVQIRNMELQIQSLEFRVKMTKDQLDLLTIKATQGGIAFREYSWMTGLKNQEGDKVWGGMPLVSIPDYTKMKVLIKASEASYKQINVNDSVEYTFDAMPGNWARGKILQKAPVGQPITEKSKVKFFEIEASMDTALHLPEPGLSVHCNVISLRIRDTIVVPQIAIFDEDSMKVVYVKTAKDYERRQVKIGANSLNKAVIISGLTGYEHISLIKPSSSKIIKTTLLPDTKNKKKIKAKNQKNISSKKLKKQ